MPSVQFFFDYKSPYSYMANTQVSKLAATVEYHPIDLVTLLVAANNLNRTSETPNKFRYGNVDLARWARRYGVRFQMNERIRGIDSVLLARGAIAAQELDVFDSYHAAIFNACWRDNTDVVSLDGRSELLGAAGIDPAPLWKLAGAADVERKLSANAMQAYEAGAFGTPTFVFEGEIFFGNDRLDFLGERLAEAAAGALYQKD